ncbi:hypothetical protein MKW92_049314 [Papaver armeniacum]|nr:hypothetical protein MKW92_049314 [Papaver armeniacum]
MQDTCNFSFESPTNSLLRGQRFLPGMVMYSSASEADHSKGRFLLIMQVDGYLTLSESRGNEMMYHLTVDVDGFFRMYSHPFTRNENWTIVWAPDKYNNCVPKGLCGSNVYYTLMDPKAYCLCLLGFRFVYPDQPTLECEREVTIQSCRSRKEEFASRKHIEELEKATNNFKEVLGRGSFGTVTKGKLSNASQTIIAVKRLEPRMVNEGEKEFLAEMKAISRTHHINLRSTFGVLPRGKVEIALSVARVIFYLHEECENQIIHCDIKPHIILMDHNNSPKITDFRLTKLLKQDLTKTFTVMGGTKGYITPEWYRNFPITVKEDVYSFGIVLMKIICCRRALNMELCLYCGKLDKLVTREEEVDMRKFERMVIVALCCIQDEPSLRPSMKNVVLMLEGTINISNPPNPDSSSSPV